MSIPLGLRIIFKVVFIKFVLVVHVHVLIFI